MGFSIALQFWAFEAIPALLECLGGDDEEKLLSYVGENLPQHDGLVLYRCTCGLVNECTFGCTCGHVNEYAFGCTCGHVYYVVSSKFLWFCVLRKIHEMLYFFVLES